MFTQEVINAFSGGYKISSSGVITLLGSPSFSLLKNVICFPVTASVTALVRRGDKIQWSGVNKVEFPYELSSLNGQWYDPLRIAANIAIQRGWKFPPYMVVQEDLTFDSAIGYYTAFVDLVVQSFAAVNGQTLSTSELVQISGEIQGRVKGEHLSHETVARVDGRENNLLIYDMKSGSYRWEAMNFEPYSLYLIGENFIAPNHALEKFRANFSKFMERRMENSEKSKLAFPYVGIFNHYDLEKKTYPEIIKAIGENDSQVLLSKISELSQSMGYNLGALSGFQRTLANMLERRGLKLYLFNIGEYSGSILLFADSLQIEEVRENVIREYYNLTNRTLRIGELKSSGGSTREEIRA